MTTPTDIRNKQTDHDYWDRFEHIWTSLLTYRYLGRTNPTLDQGIEEATMPLRHDMRNSAGIIMAAPLSIAAAECGGMHDDFYIPNPLSCSLQIIDNAIGVKRIKIIPETIKIGRSMGFSRSRLVDADNEERIIALSSGSAISLGTPPPGYRKINNPMIDVIDSPDMPCLTAIFGAEHKQTGVWELPLIDLKSASPDAALHLGTQHITLEAAATELAEQLSIENFQHKELFINHWQVSFVARGKIGPFITQGDAYLSNNGSIAVDIYLIDQGNDNRIITSASAQFFLIKP